MTTFDLSSLTDSYPMSATVPLGAGRKLELTYRDSPSDAAQKIEAAVADDLKALGLDPKAVLLTSVIGRPPTGDEGIAYAQATDALSTEEVQRLSDVMKKADGAALALVLGSWKLVQDGKPVELPPISPENCAALPDSLKRTIRDLVASATLPVERRNFSAGSAHS